MKETAPDEYRAVSNYAIRQRAGAGVNISEYMDNYIKEFKGTIDRDGAIEEITNNYIAKLVRDRATLETLIENAKQGKIDETKSVRENMNILQRFVEMLKEFVANIKAKLSNGGISAKAANENIKRAEEAMQLIHKAFNASVENASKYAGQNIDKKSGKVKYSKNSSDSEITVDDLIEIQNIGKKSVNNFTSDDIKKTEKFARKYFKEMGIKSPFFRAWFGDWRENDTTPIKVATEKGKVRGITKNTDTGWNIQVSGKVFNKTKSHKQSNNILAVPYLEYINSIVENAILLDSYTIPLDKVKSNNSAMMHSLYAVADIGNGKEIIKIYVEELNDVNSDGTIKRSYQLQNITNQQLSVKGSSNALASSFSTADKYSVSDLFNFVKQYDKNFNPKSTSTVVNDDGTPKVVYHGTNEEFNVFDIKKSGSNFEGLSEGLFFFTNKKDGYPNSALDYAKNAVEKNGGNQKIKEVYLDIKKPLKLDSKGYYSTNEYYDRSSEEIYKKYFSGDYDGIIIENSDKNSDDAVLYAVDNSKQIKSATDNIGTFDKHNSNTRYSLKSLMDYEKELEIKGKETYNKNTNDSLQDSANANLATIKKLILSIKGRRGLKYDGVE